MERKHIEYYPGIFEPYKTDMNMEHWIEVHDITPWRISFPDVMWGLGFEMDRFNSFLNANPMFIAHNLSDPDVQKLVLAVLKESSTEIVGNFLFSFFRQKTHWDYMCTLSQEEEQFVSAIFFDLDNKLCRQ